jgi:hypothetical protein
MKNILALLVILTMTSCGTRPSMEKDSDLPREVVEKIQNNKYTTVLCITDYKDFRESKTYYFTNSKRPQLIGSVLRHPAYYAPLSLLVLLLAIYSVGITGVALSKD